MLMTFSATFFQKKSSFPLLSCSLNLWAGKFNLLQLSVRVLCAVEWAGDPMND